MVKSKQSLIGAAIIASLMTTSAYSQITISGTMDVSQLRGSGKGVNMVSEGLGGGTVITVASKGKMANGMEYAVSQNFNSTATENARAAAAVAPMTTRFAHIDPVKDVRLFYTYDGVYGGEIARTAIPVLTNRPLDYTGSSTLREFIDVTSSSHAIGFEVLNLGPSGRLSFAYNPNFDSLPTSGNDRVVSHTNDATGYSFGAIVAPGPVRIAAGYTKIDQQHAANAQDATSTTLGITYTQAPFAVGAQRTISDGLKVATLASANVEDKTNNIAATYAVDKALSLGITYNTTDRTVVGATKGPKTKVVQYVAAYNLGPAVASIGYEVADNKQTSGTTVSVAGQDHRLAKAQIKLNF